MARKKIGEFQIALALITRSEEKAATFVGDELPHVIALREKCMPLVAEFGLEVHGHAFNLTSRWNGHNGSARFIVAVDAEAQVNDFEFEEFTKWLILKRDALLGRKSAANLSTVVAGASASQVDATSREELAEIALEIGSDPNAASSESAHSGLVADSASLFVKCISTARNGSSLVSTSIDTPLGPAKGDTSPELSALVNQLVHLNQKNISANGKPCFDMIESITSAVIVDTGLDTFLIEIDEFLDEIEIGASLEALNLQRTEEKAICVTQIWPSAEVLIDLARA